MRCPGFLVAELQTTPWLFIFWHLGFPASVIGYACLKDEKRTLPRSTIYWSAAFVVLLALLLTWIVTVHHDILPPLFVDRRTLTSLGNRVTGIDFLTSLLALALLWRRQKSVLDLWLTVAIVALVAELWVTTFVIGSRYSLRILRKPIAFGDRFSSCFNCAAHRSCGSLCASLPTQSRFCNASVIIGL